MKLTFKILTALLIVFAVGCGGKEEKEKEQIKLSDRSSDVQKETVEEAVTTTAEVDDLDNKGIGPIKSLDVPETIDADLASKGSELFKNLCSACHKMDKKFIGPEIAGVTERRSPEWVMNMILNPQEMIQKDPIAKKLLVESNMAVMANQGLTEDQARAIYEYFRQYDQEN